MNPPTQQPRRPEVVGPTNPAAYRSPSAKQPSIAKALSGKMGPGIKPPTPYEIGHYCVEEEYKEIVDWVNTFRRILRERGLAHSCDGWTTITRRSLLNFLAYSPLGTVFLRTVDATEYVKDAAYLNKLFNEVIKDVRDVRADCVVQIITDNDASMKKAGLMPMQQRPNIFSMYCTLLGFED